MASLGWRPASKADRSAMQAGFPASAPASCKADIQSDDAASGRNRRKGHCTVARKAHALRTCTEGVPAFLRQGDKQPQIMQAPMCSYARKTHSTLQRDSDSIAMHEVLRCLRRCTGTYLHGQEELQRPFPLLLPPKRLYQLHIEVWRVIEARAVHAVHYLYSLIKLAVALTGCNQRAAAGTHPLETASNCLQQVALQVRMRKWLRTGM